MNKALGLALFVGGVILLFMGIQASHSIASSVSRAVTGSPTDHTLALIIVGVITVVGGAVLLSRNRD